MTDLFLPLVRPLITLIYVRALRDAVEIGNKLDGIESIVAIIARDMGRALNTPTT